MNKQLSNWDGYGWGEDRPGLKILNISSYDAAGVNYGIAKAVNTTTEHSMRCMVQKPHPFGYPFDLFEAQQHKNEYVYLLDTCDVVMFGNTSYSYKPFNLPIPSDPIRCVFHQGTAYRANWDTVNKYVHPDMDLVYSHLDLWGLDQNMHILQVPYDCSRHQRTEKQFDKIVIAHSPTNPVIKRSDKFVDAIISLKKRFGSRIVPRFIQNVTPEKSIEMKKDVHFFYDQSLDSRKGNAPGWGYGLSMVEAGVFGCVGMAWLGWKEYPNVPIRTVRTARDIEWVVSSMMDRPDELNREFDRTRQFIIDNHDYPNVARQFLEPLEGLV